MSTVTAMNPPEIPSLSSPPPAAAETTMSPEQLHADLNAIRSVLNESAAARSPHRTIIAVGNLIMGFFMLITVPILLIAFSIPVVAAPHEEGVLIAPLIGLALILMVLIIASPFLAAGWGLLKHKSWGIAAALVAAALNLMNFPFGTALSIYTIWAVSSRNLVPEPKAGKV